MQILSAKTSPMARPIKSAAPRPFKTKGIRFFLERQKANRGATFSALLASRRRRKEALTSMQCRPRKKGDLSLLTSAPTDINGLFKPAFTAWALGLAAMSGYRPGAQIFNLSLSPGIVAGRDDFGVRWQSEAATPLSRHRPKWRGASLYRRFYNRQRVRMKRSPDHLERLRTSRARPTGKSAIRRSAAGAATKVAQSCTLLPACADIVASAD
jgi:hypothetical protein